MANLNLRSTASASIARLLGKMQAGELLTMEIAMQRVTLQNLESHYARFTTAHMELVADAATTDELDTHNELFVAVEDKYSQVKAVLDSAIEAAMESSASASFRTTNPRIDTSDIRLEKIHLPTFSGEFNKWLGFRDMFEAMVNTRANFSVAAKYTHLMKALKGDAAQVVAGFLPTDDNYEAAWKTLKDRYDNSRLIVSSHLNIFLGMESLQKETNSGLRRMIDITNETTRSLGAMKRPVEHWDDILVHILVSKLPKATIIHWEMEQKGTSLPKLIDLLQFLEGRARGLDHMGATANEKAGTGSSSGQPMKKSTSAPQTHTSTGTTPRLKRSNLPQSDQGKCHYCSGDHYIGKCPILEAIKPEDRFDKVKDSNLCYNCLTPGHSTKMCKSKYRCANCGGQHHTILCRTRTAPQAKAKAEASSGTSTNTSAASQQQA